MATGQRHVFNVAFLVNLFGLIFLGVAFCSPYWFQSWPRVYSPFKMVGLWEACFAGLVLPMDISQKAYHGCWWILAEEFWDIRAWLMPGWFIWCQIATTISLFGQIINMIIMMIIWVQTDSNAQSGTGKRRAPITAVHVSAVITIISACLMTCVGIVFGVMAYYDHYWMPFPDLNYLSWSYGLAVVSAFFFFFASIAIVQYTRLVREELRQPPMPMQGQAYVATQVKDSVL